MIVVINERPDQVTAAIVNDIVFNDCLNATITTIKNKTPGKFIFQSKNPLDLVRKIFQNASQKADNNSKRIPIIVGIFENCRVHFLRLENGNTSRGCKMEISARCNCLIVDNY